jgi:LysM repeat protein
MPLERATIQRIKPNGQVDASERPIRAQFNPQSLQLNYRPFGPEGHIRCASGSGSGRRTGASSERTGYIVTLSSLELQFDTSEEATNRDVRNITLRIARLIQTEDDNNAPNVRFGWGSFTFHGIITAIDETLDYFAEDGTPLRATVRLSLDMNEVERASNRLSAGISAGVSAGIGASAGIAASAGVSAETGVSTGASASASAGAAAGTTPMTFAQEGESMQSLAGRAGVDWKDAAAANDVENPRQVQAGSVINLNARPKTGR